MEILRIDEQGRQVHTIAEKWELSKRLTGLEARVEEWR
jgi:hypothetical protein